MTAMPSIAIAAIGLLCLLTSTLLGMFLRTR